MASAARAYRYSSAAPAPRHESTVRVIRGRRHQVETLDNRLIVAAKIALALLIAFAVLGCVRVGLMSTAVQASISHRADPVEYRHRPF